MATWQEDTRGTARNRSRNGESRIRTFNDQASSSADLPSMDEVHPDNPNLFVAEITETFLGEDKRRNLATVTYSPADSDVGLPADSSNAPAYEALNRRMNIGGELLTIPRGGKFYWDSTNTVVNQSLFKRVVTGTYSITEVVDDLEETTTSGPLGKIINAAGRINSSTFQGQGHGNWLYLGADLEDFRASDGDTRWRITHQFAFRTIPDSGISSSDGWHWIYNDEDGAWDRVSDSPGINETGRLYQTVDFSTIFSTSGVV